MATSVVMAANSNDHHHNNTNPSSGLPSVREEHQPKRRSYGRRKSKGCDSSSSSSAARQKKEKKIPMRGMGVEKLEKLRIGQERLKKMTTEINTTTAFSPSSFADHPTAVMNANFLKLGGFGSPGLGFGQMGFNHNQIYYNMGFGDGNVNSGFRTTHELSSYTQNVVKCFSDHCNACHKKKKVNGTENMDYSRFNGGDYGFLGLNIGQDNQQGFGTKLPLVPQLRHTVPNGKMGVEVVAIHKRGSSSSSSSEKDSVLMEYEFFPVATRSSDDDDGNNGDHEVEDEEMKKVSGFIDLSLKLST